MPNYLKSLVKEADADAAYSAFLNFRDVVKKNQVGSAAAPASVSSGGDAIGQAAKKLSDASYPCLKEVDWLSDIYVKPVSGLLVIIFVASSAEFMKLLVVLSLAMGERVPSALLARS